MATSQTSIVDSILSNRASPPTTSYTNVFGGTTTRPLVEVLGPTVNPQALSVGVSSVSLAAAVYTFDTIAEPDTTSASSSTIDVVIEGQPVVSLLGFESPGFSVDRLGNLTVQTITVRGTSQVSSLTATSISADSAVIAVATVTSQTSSRITLTAQPTHLTDATNKQYVDSRITALSIALS
jgi:hypothetical protein